MFYSWLCLLYKLFLFNYYFESLLILIFLWQSWTIFRKCSSDTNCSMNYNYMIYKMRFLIFISFLQITMVSINCHVKSESVTLFRSVSLFFVLLTLLSLFWQTLTSTILLIFRSWFFLLFVKTLDYHCSSILYSL